MKNTHKNLAANLGTVILLSILLLLASAKISFSEFQVNTTTLGEQQKPSVAMDSSGNFVIVWDTGPGAFPDVVAQKFDSIGTPIGGEFSVAGAGPSVAMDASGNFVIAYVRGYEIWARRYHSTGNPVGAEFQVNTYTNNTQTNPSIAMDPSGNFVIAWQSWYQDGGGDGIFAQRYDSTGNPVGAEFQVNTYTTSTQYLHSVGMDPFGNFVIVWTSRHQDGDGDGIFAQRYDSTGNPVGAEFQVNTYTTGDQTRPSIATGPFGNFVIAWTSYGQDGDSYGIFAQRYDSTGNPVGAEFQVNTYTTGDQTGPSVGMDPFGNFVIAWMSYGQDGDGDGIFAQWYDSNGNPLEAEFQVNTYTLDDQVYPSVPAVYSDNLLIVWESKGGQDGYGSGIFGEIFYAAHSTLTLQGLTNTKVICRNLSTRRTIIIDTPGAGLVDCYDAGLVIRVGDRIDIIVKGTGSRF